MSVACDAVCLSLPALVGIYLAQTCTHTHTLTRMESVTRGVSDSAHGQPANCTMPIDNVHCETKPAGPFSCSGAGA